MGDVVCRVQREPRLADPAGSDDRHDPAAVEHLEDCSTDSQRQDAPPITTYSFDFSPFTIAGQPQPAGATSVAYCPRRFVLDALLVEAGSSLRDGVTFDDVVVEDGQVVGVRAHSAAGTPFTEQARIVIGADGAHSRVAHAVGAERYANGRNRCRLLLVLERCPRQRGLLGAACRPLLRGVAHQRRTDPPPRRVALRRARYGQTTTSTGSTCAPSTRCTASASPRRRDTNASSVVPWRTASGPRSAPAGRSSAMPATSKIPSRPRDHRCHPRH